MFTKHINWLCKDYQELLKEPQIIKGIYLKNSLIYMLLIVFFMFFSKKRFIFDIFEVAYREVTINNKNLN
jgi:hypothetical protein